MFSLSDLIIAGVQFVWFDHSWCLVCLILSSTGVHIVWFDCQLVFTLRCSLWVDHQLVFTLSWWSTGVHIELIINWCSLCLSWSSTGVPFELTINWCSLCLVWLAVSIHFCCLVWLAASIHFRFAWFLNYCMEFICFWLLLDVTRVISCMAFRNMFTPDILLHCTEKPIQNLVRPD